MFSNQLPLVLMEVGLVVFKAQDIIRLLIADAYQQLKHWLEVVYITERIHAAYLMAGNKFNKFSIQAVLREE